MRRDTWCLESGRQTKAEMLMPSARRQQADLPGTSSHIHWPYWGTAGHCPHVFSVKKFGIGLVWNSARPPSQSSKGANEEGETAQWVKRSAASPEADLPIPTLPTLSLFIETSNKLIAVHLNALLPACAISEFDSDRSWRSGGFCCGHFALLSAVPFLLLRCCGNASAAVARCWGAWLQSWRWAFFSLCLPCLPHSSWDLLFPSAAYCFSYERGQGLCFQFFLLDLLLFRCAQLRISFL